ncbi:YidC/Oxa1 family membrane protein insertase [Anaerolentibacter hominis]|uniref:YidC/Oxa1 family membrane protein insertase n=1 Tax=Anaerolentibacter hominis TaxID=3079009 RepID=UPI0031B84320
MFLTQYDGWFLGPIAKVLGVILNGIYELFSKIGIENAALCIVVFTVLINLLMTPSTIKQQKSTKLTSLVMPELKVIQDKYKGKRDEVSMRKQNAETQALYEKYGISPTSGCLPLLITFPILFALWRVMYAIPAYIHPMYQLYEEIAVGISTTQGYIPIMQQYMEQFKVVFKDWAEVKDGIIIGQMEINHIIDILSKFTEPVHWQALSEQFPALASVIAVNSEKIMSINSFVFGMNIIEAPGFSFPGILIPIFAAASQWYQQKMMTAGTQNKDNQTMNTMNGVMKFMPIFSGIICISMPIGLGIYWITGSVVRIIQQFIVNRVMGKMDVDELVAKNMEKARKKRERKGQTTSDVEKYSRQSTRTIKDIASGSTTVANNYNKPNNKPNNQANQSQKRESKNTNYEAGSISGYAHLLDSHNEKEEK